MLAEAGLEVAVPAAGLGLPADCGVTGCCRGCLWCSSGSSSGAGHTSSSGSAIDRRLLGCGLSQPKAEAGSSLEEEEERKRERLVSVTADQLRHCGLVEALAVEAVVVEEAGPGLVDGRAVTSISSSSSLLLRQVGVVSARRVVDHVCLVHWAVLVRSPHHRCRRRQLLLLLLPHWLPLWLC